MTRNPALHRAPLGYGKNGPLTWVAECRVPVGAPRSGATGHGAVDDRERVGRAPGRRWPADARRAQRLPHSDDGTPGGARRRRERLVARKFPDHLSPPVRPSIRRRLKWLLDHGADPNCTAPHPGTPHPGTALDYVIGSLRALTEDLSACIDLLLDAGGVTALQRAGRADAASRPDSMSWPDNWPRNRSWCTGDSPNSISALRVRALLTLRGATLLHVAAEYGILEAATLLLDRGADVNARATVDEAGVGGQTAIFHAATQFGDCGLAVGATADRSRRRPVGPGQTSGSL